MPKPIIFLDFDGVLNVIPSPNHPHLNNGWVTWNGLEIGQFSILYAPELITAINELNQIAEIRWLTSWEHDAPLVVAPKLGIDAFPVAGTNAADGQTDPRCVTDLDNRMNRWWKMNVVAESIAQECRPVMWLDDDIVVEHRAFVREIAMKYHVPFQSFAPWSNIGLDKEHIKAIQRFVEQVL